jgi:hypothetical protein
MSKLFDETAAENCERTDDRIYANFNFPAIRALTQALNRNEQLKAQEEGARCDRGFDGGEWSDAWHAQVQRDMIMEIAWRVAGRFHMNGDDLFYQLNGAAFVESDRQVRAICREGNTHDAR